MSRLLMTIAVDDVTMDTMGAKEAAAMALEPLGGVQVLQVDVQEPEQLGLEGIAPERSSSPKRTPPAKSKADKPSVSSYAGSHWSERSRPPEMFCCLSCAAYQSKPGLTDAGKFYWGVCRRSGELVYSLKDQCRAWERKEVWT